MKLHAGEIRDTHLGLHGTNMRKMLALLEDAARRGESYTPYAVGEIRALTSREWYSPDEIASLEARVESFFQDWTATPQPEALAVSETPA